MCEGVVSRHLSEALGNNSYVLGFDLVFLSKRSLGLNNHTALSYICNKLLRLNTLIDSFMAAFLD